MSIPLYAIGDIHGQRTMLEDALARIETDGGRDAQVIFLGDYVDRGPDSRGVIDLLAAGLAAGRNWTCLLGNHDRMMRLFLGDPPRSDPRLMVGWDWFHPRLGGRDTLASYGVEITDTTRVYQLHEQVRAAVPDHHIAFLHGLQTWAERDELLFVHAGLVPGLPLSRQREDDLIWIRDPFLDDTRPHRWLVVHGHTPVKTATHYGNRINLDTGAGYGHPLTVARFDGTTCHLLTDDGPLHLRPQIG